METTQILSNEWCFQIIVIMLYSSGFFLSLCLMEIVVCIYAEVTHQKTDLPTQKNIHQLFMRFKRHKTTKF